MADDVRARYASLREEATALAGAPGDILPRVLAHRALWEASAGNHAFPLVALHGALWGRAFFEVTGRLGSIISWRYFYDSEERARRHAMLDRFAEGFKAVNRAVFIDTWTNFHVTRLFGERAAEIDAIHPELVGGPVRMHHAVARGVRLSAGEHRDLFTLALRHEQEVTVAPGVAAELARFDCPILRGLCMKPIVRFPYFPTWTQFFFRDFSATEERIEKAVRAYELAAEVGFDAVLRSAEPLIAA